MARREIFFGVIIDGRTYEIEVEISEFYKKLKKAKERKEKYIDFDVPENEQVELSVKEAKKILKLNIKFYAELTRAQDEKYNAVWKYVTDVSRFVIEANLKKFSLREDEISDVLYSLGEKSRKQNAILIGKKGVGKTSIVYEMSRQMVRSEYHLRYKNFGEIIKIEVEKIKKIKSKNKRKKVIDAIKNFLNTLVKPIVFIDDLTTAIEIPQLFNFFQETIFWENYKIIACIEPEKYENYFANNSDLSRFFNLIKIKEPSAQDVYGMLKSRKEEIKNKFGYYFSNNLIRFIVNSSMYLMPDVAAPKRAVDVLKSSCEIAKKEKLNMDKNVILRVYGIKEKVSNIEILKRAYNVAGKYIEKKINGDVINVCSLLNIPEIYKDQGIINGDVICNNESIISDNQKLYEVVMNKLIKELVVTSEELEFAILSYEEEKKIN